MSGGVETVVQGHLEGRAVRVTVLRSPSPAVDFHSRQNVFCDRAVHPSNVLPPVRVVLIVAGDAQHNVAEHGAGAGRSLFLESHFAASGRGYKVAAHAEVGRGSLPPVPVHKPRLLWGGESFEGWDSRLVGMIVHRHIWCESSSNPPI